MKSSLALLCALLFLQSSIFSQRNNLLFESSFEGNDHSYLDGFQNSQHCCDYSVTRTTAAARAGANAVRLEVRDDDPLISSSIRSELTIPTLADTGEMWYAFSFFLKDWVTDSSEHSILQWHPDTSRGSSVLSIHAQANLLQIVHGDPFSSQHYESNLALGSPESNVWTDFVFHVKWSSSTDGFIHVWKNGVLAYSVTGIRTEWGNGQYLKVGINHFGWSIPKYDVATERIYYVDEVRIGNASATYNDVAPSPLRNPLLFESSFEGTNGTYLDGFTNYQHCCEYSVSRETTLSRAGTNSARFEVRDDDDIVSGSIRSQITLPTVSDSTERWYGMSFYLEDWIVDESPHSIVEWQPASNGGGSFLSLLANSGVFQIVHGNNDDGFHYESNELLGEPESNTWTDFVFHVKWDTTENGFIQVWKDNVLVYDVSDIRTEWGEGQYIKFGINHFGWSIPVNDIATERIMYLDEVRIGDHTATYADVVPGSSLGCVAPTASITTTENCGGEPYYLVLDAATGGGPYQLFINKTTYNNVEVGDSILLVTPAVESIWDTPEDNNDYDDLPVELGMKFRSDKAGYITGIRFFSHGSPSGTFTGHLWSSTNDLLASATFTSVTGSAWQQVLFEEPVLIDANTTYIASYHTTEGLYSASAYGLTGETVNGSLTALSSGSSGNNGVYGYGSSPTFPESSYHDANYWVDVLFKTPVDTFYLTTVKNANGCLASGSLQTLEVEAEECVGARSASPLLVNGPVVKAGKEIVGFNLKQNYPNPVSSQAQTTISYTLGRASMTSLQVYDMNGRMVQRLDGGMKNAGTYNVVLKAGSLRPGIYYYQLHAGTERQVRKMVVQ